MGESAGGILNPCSSRPAGAVTPGSKKATTCSFHPWVNYLATEAGTLSDNENDGLTVRRLSPSHATQLHGPATRGCQSAASDRRLSSRGACLGTRRGHLPGPRPGLFVGSISSHCFIHLFFKIKHTSRIFVYSFVHSFYSFHFLPLNWYCNLLIYFLFCFFLPKNYQHSSKSCRGSGDRLEFRAG